MMAVQYRAYPGVSERARLEAWDPSKRINALRKFPRRKRKAPDAPPALGMRRVLTRFGIAEIPLDVNPDGITAEEMVGDPRIRLVPDRDLTEQERSLVHRMEAEQLPKLNPRPTLTHAQLCLMQIIAELEARGERFGWEETFQHFHEVRQITRDVMRCFNGPRAAAALVEKGMITERPRLTPAGRVRVQEHEESLRVREKLGIKEYPLVRLERHPRFRAYDEITVLKDGKERTYFRCETRGFRCSRIVYVAER